MTDKQGQEVAVADDATGMAAVVKPTQELYAQLVDAIIEGGLPPEVGDPAITAKAIQRRIAAGTFQESLEWADQLPALAGEANRPTASGGKSAKMTPPMVVHGVHFNPSSFEDPATGQRGVYAVVDVTNLETGERETFSAGGGNLKVQLATAWRDEGFPFRAVLVVIPTSEPGRETHWFKKLPDEDES